MFQLQRPRPSSIKPPSPTSFSPPTIRDQSVIPHPLPEMDPEIWSRLPGEILDHVLSLLPLRNFLNLRSTCKHFRTLIFSPSFISKHSSSSSSSSLSGSPFSSFLLLSHPQFHHGYSLYDSMLGSWRNFTLPISLLIPSSSSCSSDNSLSCTLLSSSNGLLCFSLPNSSSFLVSNLLSKSSRVIDFPIYPFVFESLTFVSTPSSGYKIFVLCAKFGSIQAFIYDSIYHCWETYNGLDPILSDNCRQEGVLYKGSMYYTTTEPFSIVCLDVDKGKWKRFRNALPGELTFGRLVSDGEFGKLYLIGGIGRNGISKMIKLWELGNNGYGGEEWIEIESLPEMMCRKFVSVCYHNYEHVYCLWNQGMICVCCYTWPEILYYKVSRKTWHWLPKCPSLPDKWSCGFKWFSFVPQFYATV